MPQPPSPAARRSRLAVVAAAALAGLSLTTPTPATAATTAGPVDGFATSDFLYANLLDTTQGNAARVTVSQSAAAVSSGKLATTNALGETVYAGSLAGKNAYGQASGVTLGVGEGAGGSAAQLTVAEAASPPRKTVTTSVVDVPAAPLATASVQPDVAEANTKAAGDFCILGKPLSQGTAHVATASLLPIAMGGLTSLAQTGEVRSQSTQVLVPNGTPNRLGLSASSSIGLASLTLFQGVAGAETTITIVDPVTLQAVAGGVPGSAKVSFGDANGKTPVVSVNGTALTLEDLLGGGVTIDFDGLLKVDIKLDPTTSVSPDGTKASGMADLVTVTFVGNPAPSSASVGGPAGDLLNPVLQPVFDAIDQLPLDAIDQALRDAGLTTGADIRVGHFEARAQVPQGGIRCGLPVTKTVDRDPVAPGQQFVYTITVTNPYDCTLQKVRVVDDITVTPGVTYRVVGTDPKADSVTDRQVVFNDVGPVKPGKSATLRLTIEVGRDTAAGRFTDHVTATAQCGTGIAGTDNVTLTGEDTLVAPRVAVPARPALAVTGGSPALGLAAAVAAAGGLALAAVRRRRT